MYVQRKMHDHTSTKEMLITLLWRVGRVRPSEGFF